MNSQGQSQSASNGINFDVVLDIRSLRARVEFDDDVPSLVISDGTATVQIRTGLDGPAVRDLLPVGRLVASALRFQTACNRFTRFRKRPAPLAAEGSVDEPATGEES